jgi:hypothetical protein
MLMALARVIGAPLAVAHAVALWSMVGPVASVYTLRGHCFREMTVRAPTSDT